jgi:uncharacterized membrane protein YhiD involved in acid resistance
MPLVNRQNWPARRTRVRQGPLPNATIHWMSALAALLALAAFASNAQPAGQFAPARTVPPMDASQQVEIQNQQAEQQKAEQEKKRRELNLQRRKQISDESAMLVQLSTELKAEVDKTDKDTLSLAVIRKAQDIEKLAHAVKENMKIAVRD